MIYPHQKSNEEKDRLLFGSTGSKLLNGELKEPKKRNYAESAEVSTIAGYIKKHYPNIPVEVVKHEGKKAKWEQNQHKKQNTDDSFPDTRIYLPNVTLMLENKAKGKPPVNAKGELNSYHHQYQYNTHRRLFNAHTKVYFAVGVSEAIEIFEQAVRGVFRPQQEYKNYPPYQAELDMAEEFFTNTKIGG